MISPRVSVPQAVPHAVPTAVPDGEQAPGSAASLPPIGPSLFRRASHMARSLLYLCAVVAAVTIGGQASAASPRCQITDVKLVGRSGGSAEVIVKTSRTPEYSARIAQRGRRIIVDLRNSSVAGAPAALIEHRGVVGGVMTQGFFSQGTHTTRILVQLLRPAQYRLSANKRGLSIRLRPAKKTAPMTGARQVTTAGARKGTTQKIGGRLPKANLSKVRFEHGSAVDRVIVELSALPSYRHTTVSATRSILELRNVRVAEGLIRQLDVRAFGGNVRAISTYRHKKDSTRVLIDVDHSPQVSAAVVRYGRSLHYVFGAGSLHSTQTGVAPDGRAARRTHTVADPYAHAYQAVGNAPGATSTEWTSDPDRAGAFLPTMTGQTRRRFTRGRRFTGRRIDLDLKDADIHNVLRMIGDVGRINVVTADTVSGSVTIKMKNVPWDQALDAVLQAKKLGMVRTGNIIRVALAEDLKRERELEVAKRKSELDLAPIETRLIPVSYATASDIQQRAKDLLSPRGSLAVDERTNVLIARDVAGNLNQVEELIRALDTQTPQVLIEARIVEATSRFQRDVGIQWGGDVSIGPSSGNETGLSFPSSIGIVGGGSDQDTPTGGLSPLTNSIPNPNFAVNLPATVGTGSGGALGLTLGSIDNSVNLAVRLSAAEATGMLRIISSPRILTLDNTEARISQGTLIPFSQVSAQGVQTVFQEAKLQLLVQPHVTADGSISMHVKINRDEPDFNQTSPRGDPTILKREAETELLVRDGHTAVIGGIYSRNTGRNVDQIPLLGDIPILGVLFQRRRSSDSRSELVIFITPRIVNRAEALGR